ncbi:hypothetical protein [Cytobacillus oceanisediminis]|nr:hypothetical protein [Cytobacillus oceanisediminis]
MHKAEVIRQRATLTRIDTSRILAQSAEMLELTKMNGKQESSTLA